MVINASTSELFHSLSTPGTHETQISELFGGRMSFEGSQPVFNKPLTILAFTNRSGSNLMADYLRQTRKYSGFSEALNWDEVKLAKSKADITSFPDYISSLVDRAPAHALWGVKASWDQMAMLSRTNIYSMFPSVRVVHVVRNDLLAQAVSHWIAHQTGKWTSFHKGKDTAPVFDHAAIERILMSVQKANCYVNCISRAMKWHRIALLYESLLADPRHMIERVAKFTGVSLDDWKPDEPKISMQRGDTNAEFSQETLDIWRSALMK